MPKKSLVIVLLASFVFFANPQKSYAFLGFGDIVIDPANLVQNTIGAVADTKKILKDFVLDPLAWSIGNLAIQKLTAQTVNWINSGFQGNPAYVTDPGQFFLNLGDNAASQFLSSTQFEALCSPFRAEVRLALVKNYLNETNNNNYACTLSTIKNNYEGFMRDFSQGGWTGWFELTQNSANNPYGAYLEAQTALNIQVNAQVGKYKTQLDQGNGFLSFEKCPAGHTVAPVEDCQGNQTSTRVDICQDTGEPPFNGNGGLCNFGVAPVATWKTQCTGAKVVTPESCDVPKETVTPGSVIAAGLHKALGSAGDRLNVVTSVNQIVGALMTRAITDVLGGGSSNGLRGVSQASNTGGKSVVGQLNPNSPESQNAQTNYTWNIFDSAPLELKSSEPTPYGSPFILLNGTNPMNLTDGETFIDPGAKGFDSNGADISDRVIATKTDDGRHADYFEMTYTAINAEGLSANPVTRRVNIVFPAGQCGTADAVYKTGIRSFGADTFCTVGLPTNNGSYKPSWTPNFPDAGEKTEWACLTKYEIDIADDKGDLYDNAPKCTARSLK